jgi:uncharacterized membrane protein YczE
VKVFAVKAVPTVNWSSSHPLNFKPAPVTLFLLSLGLTLFGLGEALMIAAGFGVSPWLVLAEGIAQYTGFSIGLTTFFISARVLLLWIPLKQTPGLGTLLNALIIAVVIDYSLPWLPSPQALFFKGLECLAGIIMVGFGSAIYLMAHLGPGPRDGLMTGLQRVTQHPIARVRTSIEIVVVVLGFFLGGTVGVGTFLFAFGIGPSVSAGLFVVSNLSSKGDDNER